MDFGFILQSILIAAIPTIVISASQLQMNAKFKLWDTRREQANEAKTRRHREEKEWRESVTQRLKDNTEKIGLVLSLTIENTRSDLIHKGHRYIDDLGMASTEEKESFHKQYTDYCAICEAAGIENDFIDQLVQQVMALPNR